MTFSHTTTGAEQSRDPELITVCAEVASPGHSPSLWSWAVRTYRQTCNDHRKDARQKYPVERSCPTDRSDRCAEALQLTEIEEIRPDERADAAAYIGKWCGMPEGQQ